MKGVLPDNLPAWLRERLAMPHGSRPAGRKGHRAAVLVPLYADQGQWHALFTRRTERVETHRGQVSFPGGLIEHRDGSPEGAAVREAQEEIGLAPGDVDLLGRLDPMPTITRFLITPVVGIIPWPYPLRPNPAEVASVFGVPLEWLADKANVEVQLYRPGASRRPVPVHFFKAYQGEVIWGATARIVLNLLSHLRRE